MLLELNDAELEVGLGIQHPMHRKKLRLAIEEHRHPSMVRYPCIGQLGHTWVASEWLPDLGLAQVFSAVLKYFNDSKVGHILNLSATLINTEICALRSAVLMDIP